MASTPLLLPHAFAKGLSTNHQRISKAQFQCFLMGGSENGGNGKEVALIKRRELIGLGLGASAGFLMGSSSALAAGLPPEEKPRLCDDACEKELENVPMVTTESGLQYKDIKVGGGPSPPVGFQVIKGLDEGLLSMKVGGKRRLYIPGSLAFPKGLTSAPGRPRVAPNSPVIFDVSLEYIPGLEDDEE